MKMECAEQSADWGPRERDEVGQFGIAGGNSLSNISGPSPTSGCGGAVRGVWERARAQKPVGEGSVGLFSK